MSQKDPTREINEPVELQAQDERCATAADSHVNIAPAEQSKESSEIPAEIFQEEDLKKWNKSIREKLTGLESQLRRNEAENEKLLAEIRTLYENEKILFQKHKSLTDKLPRIQSHIVKKNEEIRNLEEKINEVDWRVDNDQVAFLTTETEAEIKTLQKELHDLWQREQFLFVQNGQVVAELIEEESQRKKLKKKRLELRKTAKDLKTQMGEAVSLFMKNEKILADSEEMMNPAEETPPNSGSWVPSGKCLLKVGLGVAVGGLLIYSAFQAMLA